MATKKPTGVPTARQEQLRRERALNTARANMAERAAAQASEKTAWSVAKKAGSKALSGLNVAGKALTVADAVNDFRSAKTAADYGLSAGRLMQGAHPIGWVGGPIVELAQSTKQYQTAQMKALDWVDSINPMNKLRSAAAQSAAAKGAAAARKRREAAAKAKTKGKK